MASRFYSCAGLALVAFSGFSWGAGAGRPLPAFPGAEGAGAYARGGRAGKVLLVTTLEDYLPRREKPVPGSLRAAIEAKGPRTVIFRVAGVIQLKARLDIREPYITIAGQSAPGDGICLKDYPCFIRGAHDVVIRHLRCRPGGEKGIELDALSTAAGSRNVIIDHCSASWANDEVLSVSGPGQDHITVQWCLIAESMNQSAHRKGKHGYGSLVRTDGSVTFHHNLYAHHATRCPRPGTYGDRGPIRFDFRNNVIYDWVAPAGYSSSDPVNMNYVGNYLKPGPSTVSRKHAFKAGGEATRLYVWDNVVEGAPWKPGDHWAVIARRERAQRMAEPFDVAPVQTDPARAVFDKVLQRVGATLPVRDTVDARIVQQARSGTGRVIDSQKDVGGWPRYRPGTPPKDDDRDGMPDAWERDHGLDPGDPTDSAGDRDGDGYTNLEEFLNRTDPAAK